MQYQICQPHFLKPKAICSGQPYQKLRLDRGGQEVKPVVIDSSHNVIMNKNDGRFNTMAGFIGWLIYFSYVITEIMSVILVTNSTLNQFWDTSQIADWSQMFEALRIKSKCLQWWF